MSIRKAAMAALVATSMVAVPTVAAAQTNPAAKLSVASVQRAGAPVAAGKSNVKGGSLIIGVLVAAAVVAAVVIAGGGSNKATSP